MSNVLDRMERMMQNMIHERRKARQMSQDALVKQVHVTRQTINAIWNA